MVNDKTKGNIISETHFDTLKLLNRGKVRDIYDLEDHLLIVATDRISAFDVVLPNAIPFKGKVLNQISVHWFKIMEGVIPNHLVSYDVKEFPHSCKPYRDILKDRSMIVKKANPLPVECVVRGYILGSLWNWYCEIGGTKAIHEPCSERHAISVYGIELPRGLKESSRLEIPIFTPATKAVKGEHDINIPFEKVEELIGSAMARRVREISLNIYENAVSIAEKKGIIIADTKFEFGLCDGELILIDELLTPDSSRFWPAKGYKDGCPQPSFDKQFVRDYLLATGWNKTPPPPELPQDIITQTSKKYLQVYEMLTDKSFDTLV